MSYISNRTKPLNKFGLVDLYYKTMFTFLAYTNAIYMATQENVIRLPVQRCQRFQTQRECLNAMDPYCGWNKQTNLCSPTPNNNPRAAYWVQNGLSCPIMSDPVRNGILLPKLF